VSTGAALRSDLKMPGTVGLPTLTFDGCGCMAMAWTTSLPEHLPRIWSDAWGRLDREPLHHNMRSAIRAGWKRGEYSHG
jgi:hypothetical protein